MLTRMEKVRVKIKRGFCFIEASFFSAHVQISFDIVVKAEAALTYMLGWKLDEVIKHCKEKGWDFICI